MFSSNLRDIRDWNGFLIVHHVAFLLPLFLIQFNLTLALFFFAVRKRSVGHAQLMHDKGRTIHEYTRRMWLHELLEEVHTADDRAPPAQSRTSSQSFSGNHQKPSGATKDLSERFRQDRVGPNLPQETNKAQAYKESLKVATKRKKKVRLGRRRENDKKRRRARSVLTKAPPRMAI